jgi:hypothetical protein
MGSPFPPQQPYYMPPTAPYERPPSWFQRNRRLAIGAGCALVALVVLLALAFASAIFFGVMSLMKSSGAYAEAVAAARQDPDVRQAIGEPIEEGWYVTGNVQTSGPSGAASLAIPLSGPKGSGTLYVEGRKRADRWRYTVMEFQVKGNSRRIVLLREQAPASAPSAEPGAPPAQPTPDELPSQPPQ